MSDTNYKLISWVNHNYLKEIQCGIQAAHSANLIRQRFCYSNAVEEWVEDDVMVVLRGGGHDFLKSLNDVLEQVSYCVSAIFDETVPYGVFYEPELNYAATSASIIISSELRETLRRDYDNIAGLSNNLNRLVQDASQIMAARITYNNNDNSGLYEFLVRFGYWLDSCNTV
jgi:predicted ester cyclase